MEKGNVKKWVKKNKEKIIVGTSIAIGALVGIAYCIYVKDSEAFIYKPLQAKPIPSDGQICESKETADSFIVHKHIRTLRDGWSASEDKINSAEQHGFRLKPGQTWVDEYTKGGVAA